jgi:hypothetical protein
MDSPEEFVTFYADIIDAKVVLILDILVFIPDRADSYSVRVIYPDKSTLVCTVPISSQIYFYKSGEYTHISSLQIFPETPPDDGNKYILFSHSLSAFGNSVTILYN